MSLPAEPDPRAPEESGARGIDDPDPLSPDDDGSAALEAALADPAWDDLPAAEDPGRPEDPLHEPGAPHLALDEEDDPLDGEDEPLDGDAEAR